MLAAIPPEPSGRREGPKFRWGSAFFQLSLLILVSCILSFAIGGASTIFPFVASRGEGVTLVLLTSAALAVLPVIVMFPLSMIAGLWNEDTDPARSFRDGLAAAWFTVLLTNFVSWYSAAVS